MDVLPCCVWVYYPPVYGCITLICMGALPYVWVYYPPMYGCITLLCMGALPSYVWVHYPHMYGCITLLCMGALPSYVWVHYLPFLWVAIAAGRDAPPYHDHQVDGRFLKNNDDYYYIMICSRTVPDLFQTCSRPVLDLFLTCS